MKRFLLLLAVFCLCCTAAMAETTVSEEIQSGGICRIRN